MIGDRDRTILESIVEPVVETMKRFAAQSRSRAKCVVKSPRSIARLENIAPGWGVEAGIG